MAASEALRQAFELFRSPTSAGLMREKPLPGDVLTLIKIAAGDTDALAQAEAATTEDADRIRQAAVLYLQSILFPVGADHYRGAGRRARRVAGAAAPAPGVADEVAASGSHAQRLGIGIRQSCRGGLERAQDERAARGLRPVAAADGRSPCGCYSGATQADPGRAPAARGHLPRATAAPAGRRGCFRAGSSRHNLDCVRIFAARRRSGGDVVDRRAGGRRHGTGTGSERARRSAH